MNRRLYFVNRKWTPPYREAEPPAAGYAYYASQRMVQAYDEFGHRVMSFPIFERHRYQWYYYTRPNALAVRDDGAVYVAGARLNYDDDIASTPERLETRYRHYYETSRSLLLLSQEGEELPTPIHYHNAEIADIAYDAADGAVYLVGESLDAAGVAAPYDPLYSWLYYLPESGYTNVRKLAADGSVIWSAYLGNHRNDLAYCRIVLFDGDAYVLSTSVDPPNPYGQATSKIFRLAGVTGAITTLIDSGDLPLNAYGLFPLFPHFALHPLTGHVYVVTAAYAGVWDFSLRHYDNDGQLVGDAVSLSGMHQSSFSPKVVVTENAVYTAQQNEFDSGFRKYDADDLALIRVNGQPPGATFAVDEAEQAVFFGDDVLPEGFSSNEDWYRFFRFDLDDITPNTRLIWGGNTPTSTAWEVEDQIGFVVAQMAWVAVDLPSLPAPLRVSPVDWQGDRYSAAAALALRVAVSAPPRWLREFVGFLQTQTIYRLRVSGGDAPLDLPLKSFSCRRQATRDLTAVCHGLSDAHITGLMARAGGELILYSGLRFRDGAEQLEELIRVPLQSLRLDRGASSRSVTLFGRATETPALQTRPVRGVSYRNRTGPVAKERIRCEVDVYITPGDTALLPSGETWVVDEITYYVDVNQAFMEVVRAG